jgi:hypothetical protein
MVKVEGTLAELRSLFVEAAVEEAKSQVKRGGKKLVKSAVKTTTKRTKSAWQKYMAKKSNQIKFKSGPKKGRLDLSKMSRAYKRTRKGRR